MARPPLEVADVFRAHGPAWRSANAGHVSLGHPRMGPPSETLHRLRHEGIGRNRPEAAVRGERCNLWKLALSRVFRETAFESEF